jgi:hypothetical protein
MMENKISCPKCGRFIVAESGRFAPWCTGCGASLKPTAAPAAGPPPMPDAISAVPQTARIDHPQVETRQPPSYFHGFVPSVLGSEHMLYRVYATPSDLLVFAIGVGTVNYGQVVPRGHRRVVGPGGVAGAFASLRESLQQRLLARIPELDAANEQTLRDLAAWGKDEFIAGPADLRKARLDPPSFLHRVAGGNEHVGVLSFSHRKQGKVVLALPSHGDVRKAAEGLTELLGDQVAIHLDWRSSGRRA